VLQQDAEGLIDESIPDKNGQISLPHAEKWKVN
jgi:hypothetical protein